jgi:2-amino-4-hydroxy-6-hydroxymethyldihydropteridine diphosphokinase
MHCVLLNRFQLLWKRAEMKNNVAVIGIGSNISAGDNIPKMLKILRQKVDVLKISRLIQTKPIGIEDQPYYTNGAVKIATPLGIDELTALLKSIEDELGRDRTAPQYSPRTMDLDMVVWNGKIVDKDYFTRDFLRKSVQEVISS